MFDPKSDDKERSKSPCGFSTAAPSLRDGIVYRFHNFYTLNAFTVIEADPDFVTYEQNFRPKTLFVPEAAERAMAFIATTVARERHVIDVVDRAPVSKARAQLYCELLRRRRELGFDVLQVWDHERLLRSVAYRNAETIRRALHPGHYHLAEDVASAVLEAVRNARGQATLGWLKRQPGLGDRPKAAIFTLALNRRLLFVDKRHPIDDAFAVALPVAGAR